MCENVLESQKQRYSGPTHMCVVGTEGAGRGPAWEEPRNQAGQAMPGLGKDVITEFGTKGNMVTLNF